LPDFIVYHNLFIYNEKGTHTAMKSGMLAAEALYPELTKAGAEGTVATAGEALFTAADAADADAGDASEEGKLQPIEVSHK
jgi:flavin-dependent dehydrogenase